MLFQDMGFCYVFAGVCVYVCVPVHVCGICVLLSIWVRIRRDVYLCRLLAEFVNVLEGFICRFGEKTLIGLFALVSPKEGHNNLDKSGSLVHMFKFKTKKKGEPHRPAAPCR